MKSKIKTRIFGTVVMLAALFTLFAVFAFAAPKAEEPEFKFVNTLKNSNSAFTLMKFGYINHFS